ncbi:hypothetical protein [Neokomagataea anthophila]|uniref:Uncharacterized protein n=1 Tax=Neokomagataea anthophila TaxID=2826925 RepID=A0ABS5E9D4_9PROT|nr:hypothetical protein [Neokomagataea anthophila]MBR0560523.1 hypothetical protein [Neokomagataea anthophila]
MTQKALDTAHAALMTLVAVEPDPKSIVTTEAYHTVMETHAAAVEQAMRILRNFAHQQAPKTRTQLQKMWDQLTQDPRYNTPPYARSTVMSSLNTAWRGVHGWVS